MPVTVFCGLEWIVSCDWSRTSNLMASPPSCGSAGRRRQKTRTLPFRRRYSLWSPRASATPSAMSSLRASSADSSDAARRAISSARAALASVSATACALAPWSASSCCAHRPSSHSLARTPPIMTLPFSSSGARLAAEMSSSPEIFAERSRAAVDFSSWLADSSASLEACAAADLSPSALRSRNAARVCLASATLFRRASPRCRWSHKAVARASASPPTPSSSPPA
mmetsp:Transcript_54607/g.153640  ORF Transcript_54607/g.153640 Transcript_54607/m.153640 type:complete len:226 (+) Transcript_54607:1089-1766(+)